MKIDLTGSRLWKDQHYLEWVKNEIAQMTKILFTEILAGNLPSRRKEFNV